MEIMVSLVVPVYNAEKYLAKSIESMLSQSLKEMELILVNDGAKDNSLAICEEYAKKDSRITVINKKNEGACIARNTGIDIAKGKYIQLADADDYIDVTMYEKMYKKAEDNNCEIVICNVNDVKGEEKKVSLCLEEGIINMDMIIKEDFLCEKYCKLGTAVWHKIFKSELIKNNNIKFVNYNEVASEDTLFNFEAMMKAKKIYCLDEPLYNYIITEASLTKSSVAKSNMVKRCINTVDIIRYFLEKNSIKAEQYINYLIYWEFINVLSYVEEVNVKNISKAIKEYSKIKGFKAALKNIAFSSKLDKYFINHKGNYSSVNKVFDKTFSLLCFINFYSLAAVIHSKRLKRARAIQNV